MALKIYFEGISKVLPKEPNGTVNTYEKWIGEFFDFWTWQSWGKLSVRSSLILTCAKQVGLANYSCAKTNC